MIAIRTVNVQRNSTIAVAIVIMEISTGAA